MVGDVADLLQQAVAEVVRLVRQRPVEVLHHDRHTAERTVGSVCRFVARAVEPLVDDRVQRGVHLLDARDRGIDQLESV